MATLFKEVSYNLQKLMNDIEMGEIGLPDIQRPFVWKDTKVRDLFDSMYRGYPVGYLLLWANALGGKRAIGIESKQKTANLLIVDGQQRLTSLYAVVKNKEIIRENFKKERIIISFKPLEEKFVIPDAASKKSPEYIQDISTLWNPDLDIDEIKDQFIEKLSLSRDLTVENKKTIRSRINNVKNLEYYPFSALELSSNIDEEQVSEVFVRINSKGKTLNQADFILTLMSVFWDEGRHTIEEFCGKCRSANITDGSSPFNYILIPNPDQMLRVAVGLGFNRAVLHYVYSILRGKDLETGEFSDDRRDVQFNILKQAQQKALDITSWHEFLKAITFAGFIKKDIISSNITLIYAYTLFLIGKHRYGIGNYELRKIIARWFFMCQLTGRYTGSPESQMESDLSKLRNITDENGFISLLEDNINTSFTDDYWGVTLPYNLITSSATSPYMYAYYASLSVLDANGLFSQMKVRDLLQTGIRSNKSALEIHHLFPKAWLKSQGITDIQDTNQIANFALVEWSDNIKISDKAPKEYLPFCLERFSVQDTAMQYHLHALPDSWETMDYKEFLNERRKLIAIVIKEAFEKISK